MLGIFLAKRNPQKRGLKDQKILDDEQRIIDSQKEILKKEDWKKNPKVWHKTAVQCSNSQKEILKKEDWKHSSIPARFNNVIKRYATRKKKSSKKRIERKGNDRQEVISTWSSQKEILKKEDWKILLSQL